MQQEKDKEKENWWYHKGQRPPVSSIIEACKLYAEGWTYVEIGKKFNRSKSNIWVWINKFAEELSNPDMMNRPRKTRGVKKSRRLVGAVAPQDIDSQPTASKTEENAEDKIKRLERELADARMARDFYNEMINVAEKQFNINIRKKAGTRQ